MATETKIVRHVETGELFALNWNGARARGWGPLPVQVAQMIMGGAVMPDFIPMTAGVGAWIARNAEDFEPWDGVSTPQAEEREILR